MLQRLPIELDIFAVELLCSRLCHDLVSPVGAINNGVELMEEAQDMREEALRLIGDSALRAQRRLTCMRLAYGAAGSDSMVRIEDFRTAAMGYVDGGRVQLDWPTQSFDPVFEGKHGGAKVLLNSIMLAVEALGAGGRLRVAAVPRGARVEAAGRDADLRRPTLHALVVDVSPSELTPHSIQAYVTGRFAAAFGIAIAVERPSPDRLVLALSAP